MSEDHFTQQQIQHAPDVVGDHAHVFARGVDDDAAAAAFRRDHRFIRRVFGCRLDGDEVYETDGVLQLHALRKEVAVFARQPRHRAEIGRDEIDVEVEFVIVGHFHPQLDGSDVRVRDRLTEEVGVQRDLKIDHRAAQHGQDVRRRHVAARKQRRQCLEHALRLETHRELDVHADGGHEVRTVECHGGQHHRKVVLRTAVHAHEFRHLTRPVDRVTEAQVEREFRTKLDAAQSARLHAFQHKGESVHRAACADVGVLVVLVLVVGILRQILVALGVEQRAEIEAEDVLIVAEDVRLSVKTAALLHIEARRHDDVVDRFDGAVRVDVELVEHRLTALGGEECLARSPVRPQVVETDVEQRRALAAAVAEIVDVVPCTARVELSAYAGVAQRAEIGEPVARGCGVVQAIEVKFLPRHRFVCLLVEQRHVDGAFGVGHQMITLAVGSGRSRVVAHEESVGGCIVIDVHRMILRVGEYRILAALDDGVLLVLRGLVEHGVVGIGVAERSLDVILIHTGEHALIEHILLHLRLEVRL